jgi:hypothetical protein
VGGRIWIDDGSSSNTWRQATVANDGSAAIGPDGTSIPSSARAAIPISDNGQLSFLPSGTDLFNLVATASDGTTLFVSKAAKTIIAGAMTTLGAVTPNHYALVETQSGSGLFQLMLV